MAVYARKRKDGVHTWYYDFVFNGTRHRGIGGTTKTQALRAQEKIRTGVINGEIGLVLKIGNPLFEDFKQTYLNRRDNMRSHERDKLSAENLSKFFEGTPLQTITPSKIEDYKKYRKNNGVSNATINRELAYLKKMFNLAIIWQEARRNPVKDVEFLEEPPGRTRFLSEKDAQILIECSATHMKPIIFTALITGMRLQEILSLKWEQIHIDRVIEPYIEVLHTKNNKNRFIPLSNDMVKLFNELGNNKSEFVFLYEGNKIKSIKRSFGTAVRKASIKDFRFHDLRHTFASHFLMNGGDPVALKEILEHSSLKMVERYAHLSNSYKHMQINKLNDKFAPPTLFPTFQKSVLEQ